MPSAKLNELNKREGLRTILQLKQRFSRLYRDFQGYVTALSQELDPNTRIRISISNSKSKSQAFSNENGTHHRSQIDRRYSTSEMRGHGVFWRLCGRVYQGDIETY